MLLISHQIASSLHIYYYIPYLSEIMLVIFFLLIVQQQKSNLKTVKNEGKINRIHIRTEAETWRNIHWHSKILSEPSKFKPGVHLQLHLHACMNENHMFELTIKNSNPLV